MINPLPSMELFHLHGGKKVRMERREHHSPTDHDVERALAHGAQLYRCATCEDEVVVAPGQGEPGGPSRDAHP